MYSFAFCGDPAKLSHWKRKEKGNDVLIIYVFTSVLFP